MPSNAERALAACKTDVLLAADPATVTWLTGFAPDILSGPSPFAAPALAIVSSNDVQLIVSTDEQGPAEATGAVVHVYEAVTSGHLDPYRAQAAVLRRLRPGGSVATEPHALSALLHAVLGETKDASAELRAARAVKSDDEISRIRKAIALCDAGQAAARSSVVAGMTELDMWHAIVAAIEAVAGERVPLLADLVTGPRTADIGGPPTPRKLLDGDLVLCDLVPRLDGVWGDSCSTFAIGTPPSGAREAHRRACDTLDHLVAAVRPGVTTGELDRLGRASGLAYPHHTGHGLGAAYHEAPRVVADAEQPLEPGMIVAFEPGTYPGPWGLRVERVILVTPDGCQVLSGHSLALERA